MGARKTNVAVFCGGRSGEHEISLLSAKSVLSAINRTKYDVVVVGIRKDGSWYHMGEENFLKNPDDPSKISLSDEGREIVVSPAPSGANLRTTEGSLAIDVVFPILHGTYGEDGTLQGMLDMLGIPYVGAGYLGSALAMDKEAAKRIFKEAELAIVPHLVFHKEHGASKGAEIAREVEKKLGYPVFVKPANLGSSVGIHKVGRETELLPALQDAWQYDTKVLVEKGIEAREIECALLGNDHVTASELGEIVPRHSFYSYEAKYLDPDGAELIVGAKLDAETKSEIQETAKRAFKALCCEGMARADFFVDKKTGKVYINELNTIPGFTKISMYPKLMEASGISYSDLIDRLIQLALKRHEIKKGLKTDFKG